MVALWLALDCSGPACALPCFFLAGAEIGQRAKSYGYGNAGRERAGEPRGTHSEHRRANRAPKGSR